MKNIKNILWGIILIIIGTIIGTNALGITNINIFFKGWWTLIIIIPCFIDLFKESNKTGNIIGILIGTVLLLCCQDILDFNKIWELILPTILIIIGLSIIFKDIFNSKINSEIKKLNEKRLDKGYCSTFSSQNIKLDKEKFTSTNLDAVFGGIELDLRNSIIEKDVVINCSCIFGGIDIYVPENVRVKVKSNSIFGGVDQKKRKNNTNESSPIIYINATCIFGGVEIK